MKYEEPTIAIIKFEEYDVITLSGVENGDTIESDGTGF